MTREEAINEIKSWDFLDEKEIEAIQTLIPELEDNEDEKIIMTINNILPFIHDEAYTNNGTTKKDVLNWLEKQKEYVVDNRKASTSYDDRIRKAIIKSIEEDSSVYEQEVSKEQMIAYLEKQKDTDKAIEAVDRIDKYIDEHLANAHDMKDSNPEKKYYRGWDDALAEMSRILQDVYSNEKQKECVADSSKTSASEDERIRKEIINYILYKADGVSEEDEHRWVTWLEKQRYDRMQPVYDNQESFESALDKAWKSYNDSGERTVDGYEDNYTECAHAKGFREGYLFGLEKQKEQKSTVEKLREISTPADEDWFEIQKQWEKEDEVYLQDALWCVKQAAKVAKDENDMGICWSAERFLKSLPLNLKKKNEDVTKLCSHEWNKEDQKTLDCIINVLDRLGFEEFCKSSREQDVEEERFYYKEIQCLKRLKSLKPSWKPSEQEKSALRTAICVLTEERNFPKTAEQLQAILDAFDGKESRKEWKPSEEQMEALKNSAYGSYQNGDGPILRELYEQLKKLM